MNHILHPASLVKRLLTRVSGTTTPPQLVYIILLAILTALVLRYVLLPLFSFLRVVPAPAQFPGPRPLPIIGIYHIVAPQFYRILDYFHEQFEAHKSMSIGLCGALGQSACVVTCDPALVRHVLGDVELWVKGDLFHDIFEPIMGDGIFNADGKLWAMQRKTASHLFTRRELSTFMTHTFVDHSRQLVAHLQAKIDRGNDLVDMADLFYRFTLDTFGVIAFGETIGCLEAEGTNAFGKAFDEAQNLIEKRFYDPIYKQKLYLGSLLSSQRTLASCLSVINGFVGDIVRRRLLEEEERVAHPTRHSSANRQDLLSLYLKHARESQTSFTPTFLRDIVMNFIIAGRDTSSVAMQWIMYEIQRHPDVQRTLLAEIDGVVGPTATPTFDAVHRSMPYLSAVVDEGLRLYPPVPKNIKVCTRDHESPAGFLPKGTHVSWIPWSMSRRREMWGPDADQFRPERWLAKSFKRPTAYDSPIFQAGRRTCLGQRMALTEIKVCLAMLLQRFTFRLSKDPAHAVRYKTTVTLMMENGLHMHVEPRRKGVGAVPPVP